MFEQLEIKLFLVVLMQFHALSAKVADLHYSSGSIFAQLTGFLSIEFVSINYFLRKNAIDTYSLNFFAKISPVNTPTLVLIETH